MRRWLLTVSALALAATSCSVEPLDDPGLGDKPLSTVVHAVDGSVLAEWHAGENRVPVTFAELPSHLVDAVVAIEDERFWLHGGVDLQAMARALLANVESGEVVQGGSTITQQYLKNVLLSAEVTIDRKVEELIAALRLEESLSKEDILERYLNAVYFGAGAYGVGTAARTYFAKDVSQLTLAESALLAGLIRAPSALDPYHDEDAALGRRRVVLDKMADLGWIDPSDRDAAADEPLDLVPRDDIGKVRYPYFVAEVQRRLLADPAIGETPDERYEALFRGGLHIYTTLDPAIQDAAEQAMFSVLPEDGPSGAMVAIDPRNGHVRALIGGRDFYDPDDPVARFNLATQGRRQPGSAFKPFVLAAAIEAGLSLDSVFDGGENVTIVTPSGDWFVENYDGANFPRLTLTEATVYSVNVVYARVMDLIGPTAVADLAERAGISGDLLPYHSLALGGQAVTVLDLTSAYGTFANGGDHVEPVFVTEIEDGEGVNHYTAVPLVDSAVDADVAATVTAALTEVVRRGTGQQARIGRTTAGKTGTSEDHVDAWFVGYTPELVAGIWLGFPEGAIPMEYPRTSFSITGGTWPANIWARFASEALEGVPYGELATIDGDAYVTVDVDTSTGFLAGPLCPREHVQTLRMPLAAAPSIVCPIHNPEGLGSAEPGVMPDLIGLSLPAAVSTLTMLGNPATIDWVEGDGVVQGTVFGQNPAPSTAIEPGAVVRLVVAGPEPGAVTPALLGQRVSDAVAHLGASGLAFEVVTLPEDDPNLAAARSGIVWKQDPAGGSAVAGPITVWANP
jgi:penicillin-binding protein 1A